MAEIELVIDDLPVQQREVEATEEDIATLAKDIKQHGLHNPITVFDGQVVDGLKRVLALGLLGRKTVKALVSTDFTELCDHIAAQRPEGRDSVGRAMDMLTTLWPARDVFTRKQKSIAGQRRHLGRFHAGERTEHRTPRAILGRAIGWGDNRTEILTLIVRTSMTDPVAREKAGLVRSGQMSVYAFQTWHSTRNIVLSPIAPAEEVRMVMERGLRAVNTALETMGKFGSVDVLTMSEREIIAKELNAQRVKILQLFKQVRNGMLDEVEETKE